MAKAKDVSLGWDDEADVVVVGGGGAGLRAALAAAKGGADTILLEKMDKPGGKTFMSIGIMTASATRYQKKAGVADSHAKHFADLAAMAKHAGQPLDVPATKFMIKECSAEIDTLDKMGVHFTGPHPEGPHGTPRMHVIQPDCRSMVDILVRTCKKAGVRIECDSPGFDLVLDHTGAVAGVRAKTKTGERHIKAKAVVLTAGDYSANTEMVMKLAPNLKLAQPLRTFATGEGHQMAMRIGAATRNMNRINMPQMRFPDWPHVEPSPGLVAAGAKLVTRKGERIKTQLGESVLMPGFENRWEDIFIVIDKATAAKLATAKDDSGVRDGWYKTGKPFIGTAPGVGYAYLEDCKDWTWYRRSPTIEAAARHIGATPARLKAALGRGAEGPFHVLGPVLRVIANSGGGLSTDFKMNVVAESDGKPIKGLYGGGVNARLISFLGGHGYALAWAMASGRIAGESAAKYATSSRRR